MQIDYYAAKRNGDQGQKLGVCFAVVWCPEYDPEACFTVMVQKDGEWFATPMAHMFESWADMMTYFDVRVKCGWFLVVDDPDGPEAMAWRAVADTPEEQDKFNRLTLLG